MRETTPGRAGPGRPRRITRERIADVGIEMTLPLVTFTGLAKQLGVTFPALYKHVDGIDDLRLLIAEEIFGRWELPPVGPVDVAEYLAVLAESLRELVHEHPGIARYLARVDTDTPVALRKIDQHHTEVAARYGLTPTQASWLLSTVAAHAVALADTVYPSREGEHVREDLSGRSDLETLSRVEPIPGPAGPSAEFALSMRALVIGALSIVRELP